MSNATEKPPSTSKSGPKEMADTPATGRAELQFTPKSAQSQVALHRQALLQRENNKLKYPPQAMKMATVTVSAKSRPSQINPLQQKANYVEPFQRRKVLSWDEAQNARPPLRIDMDGPGPCSYSIPCRPPKETVAPAYSFGRRSFVEKSGGARTSWEKTWFQNSHVWHSKTDFHQDKKWPSPPAYNQESSLGPIQQRGTGYPAYSIGVRKKLLVKEHKEREEDPAPNEYDNIATKVFILPRAPSFSHGLRRGGTVLWNNTDNRDTPGPGAYRSGMQFVKHHSPSFSIQGIRREKAHEYGPFATL